MIGAENLAAMLAGFAAYRWKVDMWAARQALLASADELIETLVAELASREEGGVIQIASDHGRIEW